MAFLCLDIGGTNTLIGYGNHDFEVLEKTSSRDFLDDITGSIEKLLDRDQIDATEQVAVAAAGPIDREKGVFHPPNIPDRSNVKLRQPLQEFGPVNIANDCASAVLGEYHYGDHDTENLVYITISSGIGAGAILDGRLIEGWKGNFGEIGHIVVGNLGVECGCGGRDHWEAYCSGNGIPKLAESLTGADFRNAVEVFESAGKDEDARKTLEKMKEYNARGFSTVVNMFNPEKIAVGGAVALNHPEVVVDPLEDAVGPISLNDTPSIEVCSLEDEAVIHGLRWLCGREASP